MGRFHATAMAMMVVISASATTHFTVGTVVSFPCTISASMNSGSGVSCASPQNNPAHVSYVTDSSDGDMIMTVEF